MRTKKYKEVKVFVTPALHRAIRIAAVHMGLSVQAVIRSAVGEWLDRQERAGLPGVPTIENQGPFAQGETTRPELPSGTEEVP